MFLQFNNSNDYASIQQLATEVAILRGRLNMMRLDHPDRDALLTEFTTLQGQLKLVQKPLASGFGPAGFTF